MTDFPEFDGIVARAQASGATLTVRKTPAFCSAIMADGEFKGYNLVAAVRIDGAGPELCDPNEEMMSRLGLAGRAS